MPMKKYLLLLLLLFSIFNGYSQEEKKKETIYSFMPQYLINRGIRVDVERQIGSRNYLMLCPQFYLSEKDEDNFF